MDVCRDPRRADRSICQVFSPGIWWIKSKMNLLSSDVQILTMYS